MGAATRWVDPGPRTVLVIEPDQSTTTSVVDALGPGLLILTARTGEEALECLDRVKPHLVLLAFDLPDIDPLVVCRRLKGGELAPTIFISGLDPEAEALASYASGVDAYIVKPYRLRELEARIRAALRRAPWSVTDNGGGITVGDVTLHVDQHLVVVRHRVVRLPLREFQLLAVLITSTGKTWSRELLMRRIWTEMPQSGTKSLDVHVRRIRAKIEDDPTRPTRILTVRGVGYRYAPQRATRRD